MATSIVFSLEGKITGTLWKIYKYSMRIYKYSMRFRVPALDQSDCSICYNYDLKQYSGHECTWNTSLQWYRNSCCPWQPHLQPHWHAGKVTECGKSLADWQAAGNDPGTTASTFPDDEALIAMIRQLLSIPWTPIKGSGRLYKTTCHVC